MSPHPRTTESSRGQVTEIRPDLQQVTREPRLKLSLSQILAGALAAASAAVAASWLGVAGTVLGAVVASVVVSVSTAVYHRPLQLSTEAIRQSLPSDRFRGYGPDGATETLVLDPRAAESEPALTTESSAPVAAVPTPEAGRRRIQWGTVLVSSVLTLVVGFGLLTTVEAFLGRSVSGDGGSTLSRIVQRDASDGNGSDNGDQSPNKPTDSQPTDDQPTDAEPTDPTPTEPTDTEPTDPTPTEPTETEPTDPTPTEPTQTDPAADDDGATEAVPSGADPTTLSSTTL